MANALKVRARLLAEGRLHPNTMTPNGKRRLEQSVPDRLVPWPEASFNGAYVLLLPTEKDQEKIGKMAVQEAEQLHCTAAYLGTAEDLKVTGKELAETLRVLATDIEPIRGKLGGIIRFTADNDYHLDPIVLNVDSPGVNAARDTILRRMKHEHEIEPDDEHGYTPHLTLGYLPHKEPLIASRLEETDVTFDRIRLGFAGEEFDIRLGGRAARDAAEGRQPSVKGYMLNPFYRVALEHKVRRVRTLSGVRRFGLPINSVIVADPVNEFPAEQWDDDTEHTERVLKADDKLFKDIEVDREKVKSAMKHKIVTDLSRRMEDDVDAELLSKAAGTKVTDEPTVFTNVEQLGSYLRDLAEAARSFHLWTEAAQSKVRQDFGVPQDMAPAEHYRELTGKSLSDGWTDGELQNLLDTKRIVDPRSTAATTRYNMINTFIMEWAYTSKDYNMQTLAGEQFDLRKATTEHLDPGDYNLPTLSEQYSDEERREAWRDVYGHYLDAVYDATQERLAEAGIKDVALYRGMDYVPEEYKSRIGASRQDVDGLVFDMANRWSDEVGYEMRLDYSQRRADVLNEGGNPGSDQQLSDIEDGIKQSIIERLDEIQDDLREMGVDRKVIVSIMHDLRLAHTLYPTEFPQIVNWNRIMNENSGPMDVNVGTQPLSSWTTSEATAKAFGSYVYKIVVPAERVWSTALTGAGCLSERELILVGGVDRARVEKSGH